MATVNLRGMGVDALLSLRAEIDKKLGEKRSELEQQLSRLGVESDGGQGRGRGRRSAMKGRKVAPKYRGPGEKPGRAAVLDRDGSRRSSRKVARSTSSRSINWRSRAREL